MVSGSTDQQPAFADNVEASLTGVLYAVKEAVGAAYAALGILNPEGMGLEHFITAGIDARTRDAIGHHPRGRGVLGLLLVAPALRLHDVARDPRSYGFPPGHPEMHSFLGVPVIIGGEPSGNLYVTEKLGGAFDEADERTAITAAAQAAAVMEDAHRRLGPP